MLYNTVTKYVKCQHTWTVNQVYWLKNVKCKNGGVQRRLYCCSCKLYDRITPLKGKLWSSELDYPRQVLLLKCRYQPMKVNGHVYVCKGCRFFLFLRFAIRLWSCFIRLFFVFFPFSLVYISTQHFTYLTTDI